MTAAGYYEQSYPPSVYSGGEGPGPVQPTAAVAGTPGHYLPAWAVVPADGAAFAALNLAAQPTTAWLTGQYVPLGDGGQRHWSGASWVVGPAALQQDEQQQDEPPPRPDPRKKADK